MQLQPLASDQAVIVYLDFKSPYAYLAVEPTRRMEQELGIRFDWRPFVLDIPSYLGSAALDETGQVTSQDRSAEQWAAIKYAYYDCRRYASASNLTIRGTTKIWNTNLAATAMLWVREVAVEQLPRFIDLVYCPFWKRELDIEDGAAIAAILNNCGLNPESFEQWALAAGTAMNDQLQAEAFNAGIYGVPSYVVNGEVFFGREHLPRIVWLLGKRTGPAPDTANLLPPTLMLDKAPSPTISVGIDRSLDSLLGIPLLKSLLDQHKTTAVWNRVTSQSLDRLIPAAATQSRGEIHRQRRVNTNQLNLQRYGNGIQSNDDLDPLINQTLKNCGIELGSGDGALPDPSPFPGIVVKLDEQLFIGRQHLPLISALLSAEV